MPQVRTILEAAFDSGPYDASDAANFSGGATAPLPVTATLGQRWVLVRGNDFQTAPNADTSTTAPVWGTDGAGAAKLNTISAASTRDMAIIEGVACGRVDMNVSVGQNNLALVFRYQDPTNWWCIEVAVATLNVTKCTNGIITTVTNTGASTWGGTGLISVNLQTDGSFQVMINSVVKATVTDTFLAEQYRVGMQALGTGAGRISSFSCTQSWTPLSHLIAEEGITIKRGRQRYLDRTASGTMDAIMRNDQRQLDPQYSSNILSRILETDIPIRVKTEYPWLPGVMPNWDFSLGVTPWVTGGGSLAVVASPVFNNMPRTLQFTSNGSATPALDMAVTTLAVTAGKTYVYTCRMEAATTDRNWTPNIQWYNNVGGVISTVSGTTRTDNTFAENMDRVRYDVSGLAPAGAVTAKVYMQCTGTPANGEVHFLFAPVFEQASALTDGYRYFGYVEQYVESNMEKLQDSRITIRSSDLYRTLALHDLPESPWAATILQSRPLAWYRLNDTTFTAGIADASGGARTGQWITSAGTGLQTEGPGSTYGWANENKAVTYLETRNIFYAIANTPPGSVPSGNAPFSVIFWCRGDWGGIANGNVYWVLDGDGTFDGGYWWISTSRGASNFEDWHFVTGVGGSESAHILRTMGTNPLLNGEANNWIMVTGVFDGSAAKIYIDSVRDGSFSGTGTAKTGSPMHNAGMNFLQVETGVNALLSEVVVLPYAVTPAQKTFIFNSMKNGWDGDTADARYHRILDLVNVPYRMRSIDPEVETLQGTHLGTTALEYIQSINENVAGSDWMGAEGKFHHHSRKSIQRQASSSISFGASGVPFESSQPAYSNERIINFTRLGREGASILENFDRVSRMRHNKRVFERTGLMLRDDSFLIDLSNYLIGKYKNSLKIIDTVVVKAMQQDQVLSAILTSELMDIRATIALDYFISPDFVQDCTILGIDDTVVRGQWNSTLYLSPADIQTFLLLDDNTYGTVDGSNVLAY